MDNVGVYTFKQLNLMSKFYKTIADITQNLK